MKKIILGLFLILGVVSFSALELDKDKLQKNNYIISNQAKEIVTLRKLKGEDIITAFYISVDEGEGAKEINEMTLYTVPRTQKFLSSEETEKAYIIKFKDTENDGFSYSFVGKNPKVKGWYISIIYLTDKDLNKEELNKVIDNLLNEVESFIK